MPVVVNRKSSVKKPRKKRDDKEGREQAKLIEWAESAYFKDGDEILCVFDYLFHIPNGGKRSMSEAVKLKKQGVKAGVHDLFLPVPRHGFHGKWVEMKAEGGRKTKEQILWGDKMQKQGYAVFYCWGWEAAAESITAYLGGVYTKTGRELAAL